MSQYLEDLRYFADNFVGTSPPIPGAQELINCAQRGTKYQIDEIAQTIRKVKEAGWNNSQIQGFDRPILDLNGNPTGRFTDIRLNNAALPLKYNELKSYVKSSVAGITSSSQLIGQFKAYFKGIENLNELKYSFDAKKLLAPTAIDPYPSAAAAKEAIEKKFKKILENPSNAMEILENMSPNLKSSLGIDPDDIVFTPAKRQEIVSAIIFVE